ncbi:MAG: hypothetical protein NC489_21380 [Ruminococcus flavefaciens]|nr:hypothetical protein [Ruminococcus flavefaciens]
MSEYEICAMYREAKNKNMQINILAELNGIKPLEIIKVLLKNGEDLPQKAVNRLYKRLDTLEGQIADREREYKEIVEVITMGNRRETPCG